MILTVFSVILLAGGNPNSQKEQVQNAYQDTIDSFHDYSPFALFSEAGITRSDIGYFRNFPGFPTHEFTPIQW
jgi:flavin-binding protein dodecin